MVKQQEFPGDAYNPFEDDIMYGGTSGKFSIWEKEMIDRENITFPEKYNTWYDYQPENTVLEISGRDGKPLPLSGVKIYSHARTPEHKQVVDEFPEYKGQTDSAGNIFLGENILGAERKDSMKVFLVEITFKEQIDYQWFSFIDVNFAYTINI